MIMNGKTPTLISGVPNVAFSDATIRSHASASPSAPARQCPLTAAIDGLPRSPISQKSRRNFSVPPGLPRQVLGPRMLVEERDVGREAGEVAARAERRLVRAGEHRDAYVVVG